MLPTLSFLLLIAECILLIRRLRMEPLTVFTWYLLLPIASCCLFLTGYRNVWYGGLAWPMIFADLLVAAEGVGLATWLLQSSRVRARLACALLGVLVSCILLNAGPEGPLFSLPMAYARLATQAGCSGALIGAILYVWGEPYVLLRFRRHCALLAIWFMVNVAEWAIPSYEIGLGIVLVVHLACSIGFYFEARVVS